MEFTKSVTLLLPLMNIQENLTYGTGLIQPAGVTAELHVFTNFCASSCYGDFDYAQSLIMEGKILWIPCSKYPARFSCTIGRPVHAGSVEIL